MEIFKAFIKAYLYTLRRPLEYRVVSKTTILMKNKIVCEELSYIGVMQDVPDVTPHSIIHKLVPIKTYYGQWEKDPNPHGF